jgi:hypothetical protein
MTDGRFDVTRHVEKAWRIFEAAICPGENRRRRPRAMRKRAYRSRSVNAYSQ